MGLFSFLGRRQPATVATDRIVPLRYWDDLDYLRSICHDFTFRFDDVLDKERLRAGLDRLLKIGDWSQLGARLRLNVRGSRIDETYLTRASYSIKTDWNTIFQQGTARIGLHLSLPQPTMA